MGAVKALLDEVDPLDDPFSDESIAAEDEERARRRLRPEPAHLVRSAYHYTPVTALPAILETGELRPHRGLLWFTRAERYDAGAEIYVWKPATSEFSRAMTIDEVHRGGGLARFQARGSVLGLLDWPAACREQQSTREDRVRVERWARRHGKDVRNWYATTCPLAVDETRVQVWTGRAWRTCTKGSLQRLARWRELLL